MTDERPPPKDAWTCRDTTVAVIFVCLYVILPALLMIGVSSVLRFQMHPPTPAVRNERSN